MIPNANGGYKSHYTKCWRGEEKVLHIWQHQFTAGTFSILFLDCTAPGSSMLGLEANQANLIS